MAKKIYFLIEVKPLGEGSSMVKNKDIEEAIQELYDDDGEGSVFSVTDVKVKRYYTPLKPEVKDKC